MGDIHPAPSQSWSSPPSHRRAALPVPHPTESLWQTSRPSPLAHHRSTPALPEGIVDVVVIGSGITGVFCVRELVALLDRGVGDDHQGGGGGGKAERQVINILGLEARTLCSGATGRNGGHLIPNLLAGGKDRKAEWEVRGCEDVERAVRAWGGECEFRRVEGVSAWWERGAWGDVKRGLRGDHGRGSEEGEGEGDEGFRVRVVERREELRDLGLEEGCVGALVQGWAATLSPYRLVTGLWEDLLREYEVGRTREEGEEWGKKRVRLNLQTDTAVERLGEHKKGSGDDNAGWEVVTTRGTVTAKHVVVATNGWTSLLLKEFTGVIVPTQGQMTALKPPERWEEEKRLLKHDYGFNGLRGQDRVMNDYVVHRPWKDGGHLMCGGGRQWVRDGGEGVSDDSYNSEEAVQHLRRLGEVLDFDGRRDLELSTAWSGIMGYSRDGCPWVGAVPGTEGLWVSAAYTGHGMPNAPGCGRHVARLVVAALEGRDWREKEREAVRKGEILEEFVLHQARLAKYELSSA